MVTVAWLPSFFKAKILRPFFFSSSHVTCPSLHHLHRLDHSDHSFDEEYNSWDIFAIRNYFLPLGFKYFSHPILRTLNEWDMSTVCSGVWCWAGMLYIPELGTFILVFSSNTLCFRNWNFIRSSRYRGCFSCLGPTVRVPVSLLLPDKENHNKQWKNSVACVNWSLAVGPHVTRETKFHTHIKQQI
jgi:hypothetical protein